MISMYELKLGNEKLEALNFLLESMKDLTAALQELDVSGLKSETAEIKENIAKASALNQSLKELRAHLENNDFSALLAAYNEAKPKLDGFDAKMSEFDEKYAKIEDAAASLPEIKTKIEQATQLLENALPSLTAKIDEFNQKIADGQTKLEQTSQDFQTKYGELVKLKGELETLKGEINTLLLQGVINDEQTATTTTFSSVKIKAEMDALKNQIPDTSNLLTSESAEQTFAKKTDIPDVSGKLDTATAETIYAKKTQIPNVSGFLKTETAEKTYMKKGEVPNIDGLVTKEDAEKTYAKKDDVSLSLETKLGKNEKASDSAMLEGNAANAFVKIADVSSEATGGKIVKRNEAGDIYTKAIYSEKLNLGSTVEDGALVANSTVLFSENGSELVRKASIGKLKELVASEADLSGYVKKTDADKAYLGKNEEAFNSKRLGGFREETFPTTEFFKSTADAALNSLSLNNKLNKGSYHVNDNVFSRSKMETYKELGQDMAENNELSTNSVKFIKNSHISIFFEMMYLINMPPLRREVEYNCNIVEKDTINFNLGVNFFIPAEINSITKDINASIEILKCKGNFNPLNFGKSGLIVVEQSVIKVEEPFTPMGNNFLDCRKQPYNIFSYFIIPISDQNAINKSPNVIINYRGSYR